MRQHRLEAADQRLGARHELQQGSRIERHRVNRALGSAPVAGRRERAAAQRGDGAVGDREDALARAGGSGACR